MALLKVTAQSYAANVAAAALSLDAGNLSEAQRRLSECAEALRGWEWRHFQLRQDLALHKHDCGDEVIFVAVSSDSKYIATASPTSWTVLDSATGQVVDTFGYPVFFLGAAAIGVPVFLLIVWAARLQGRREGQAAAQAAG